MDHLYRSETVCVITEGLYDHRVGKGLEHVLCLSVSTVKGLKQAADISVESKCGTGNETSLFHLRSNSPLFRPSRQQTEEENISLPLMSAASVQTQVWHF